jgi:hypothetical protein
MVTAELAVALPSLLLVLMVGLSAVALAADRVRCADMAAVTGRLAARGESAQTIATQVHAIDARAHVSLRHDGTFVTVEVRRPFSFPLVGRFFPAVTLDEKLVVLDETAAGHP